MSESVADSHFHDSSTVISNRKSCLLHWISNPCTLSIEFGQSPKWTHFLFFDFDISMPSKSDNAQSLQNLFWLEIVDWHFIMSHALYYNVFDVGDIDISIHKKTFFFESDADQSDFFWLSRLNPHTVRIHKTAQNNCSLFKSGVETFFEIKYLQNPKVSEMGTFLKISHFIKLWLLFIFISYSEAGHWCAAWVEAACRRRALWAVGAGKEWHFLEALRWRPTGPRWRGHEVCYGIYWQIGPQMAMQSARRARPSDCDNILKAVKWWWWWRWFRGTVWWRFELSPCSVRWRAGW